MTAARTSAQNAAMEALLEAHATELKLPTVKARFRAMATEATREQQTLRPRPTASDSATAARAQREHFRHHQQPTTTDARWGHFKRRRWGHCKWRHSAVFVLALLSPDGWRGLATCPTGGTPRRAPRRVNAVPLGT